MSRFSAAARSNHPQHASVYAAHAFAHDASKLIGAADSCGNSASPEDIWSEWQDLNLRPPRPERGYLSPAHRKFSDFRHVRRCLFTFGCCVPVPVTVPGERAASARQIVGMVMTVAA